MVRQKEYKKKLPNLFIYLFLNSVTLVYIMYFKFKHTTLFPLAFQMFQTSKFLLSLSEGVQGWIYYLINYLINVYAIYANFSFSLL